jgi:tetratricopeptide (TPR) repeat protein
VARFDPLEYSQLLATKEITSRDTVGLGEWSLEHAPNPEALRGLLLRLHQLIQAKKLKYFSSEFFNLLSFLKVGQEETQEALEILEQQFVKFLEDNKQSLVVHTSQHETFHTETQHIFTAEIQNLKTELFARLPLDNSETTPSVQEKIAHAKVDNARDLLQIGQARAAQHLLERLRRDIAQQVSSPNLQFRIATNLGGCALHFEDLTTAKAEFSLALTLQPDDPKALVNAAQVALLNNEIQEALRLTTLARQRASSDPHTTSLYLQALHEAQPEQCAQLLRDESWIMQSGPCCQVLGQIHYHEGRYQEAEDCLRIALQEEPDNAQILMLLAQVLIAPLQETLRGDPPLAWRISEDTHERFHEVEHLFTRAVTALEHFDNRRPLRTALSNRAATRIMRGAWDEALKDCDRILAEDPTHSQAQLHRGLALLQLDKPAEAARCFEQIQMQEEIDASVIPCAQAYYESDQPSKVIALLLPQWQPLSEDHRQIAIAHLLLMAYDHVKNVTAQEGILDALATTWPHHPDALALMAFQRNRAGKGDEAIGLLQEAIACATTPSQRERLILEIAQCQIPPDLVVKF